MTEQRRFSDWEEVDCEECAHYWDSSCDGLSEGSRKPCTSFLATRSVVIPLQIKSLRTHIKWLYGVVLLEALGILVLGVMFNG